MKAYYEQDADLNVLKGKTVAILGYGSQGHAHAQNLRDSGVNVIVGQRPGGPNYELAKEHGFEPLSAAEAAEKADMIMILLPDEHQAAVYERDIKPHLRAGKSLLFAHGLSDRMGSTVVPPQNEPPSPQPVMTAVAAIRHISASAFFIAYTPKF